MSVPSKPKSALRRCVARSILLLCSVGAALVVAEIVFRIAGLFQTHPRFGVGELENVPSNNFAPDSRLGWRMPKSTRFTMNVDGKDVLCASDAEGFRIDPDSRPARDPRHLVAAGDSFTWGTGVALTDAFPSVLADLLGGWKVTNVAQPGYAIDQIWQSVVLEGIPRAPDLIVVGIYQEDFERSLSAYRLQMNKPTFRLEDGRLVKLTASDRAGPVTHFLERHSRVFTLARQLSVNAGFRFGVGEMWNLNAAMLDEIARAGRDARIPVIFVGVPPATLDPFLPLAAHMKKSGALFVDPLAAMKARSEPSYLAKDMHLNESGHRLIANEILTFLREHADVLKGRPTTSSRTR